jgi:hypothetical protein
MQRCVTTQSDLRAVDEEHSRVAERRTANVANLGPRQETQFHQASGVPVWKANGVDNTPLA